MQTTVYFVTCEPKVNTKKPNIFNFLADFSWITQNSGVSYLIQYLDDYLTIGASTLAVLNLDIFISLCADLGVPLASDKLNRPSASLSFLGIILDTDHMEISLQSVKLTRMQALLQIWLPKKSYKEADSDTGTYPSACYKGCQTRRSLVAWMYLMASKLCKIHIIIWLNGAFAHILYGGTPSYSLVTPTLPAHPDFLVCIDAYVT